MSTKPQSGRTRDEAEALDGMKVKLLAGTKRGMPGQIVVLSRQSALAEINKGLAVSQEN